MSTPVSLSDKQLELVLTAASVPWCPRLLEPVVFDRLLPKDLMTHRPYLDEAERATINA